MRILTMCIFLIKYFTNHPGCVYIINSQTISCNIYIVYNQQYIILVAYTLAVSSAQPSCLLVYRRVCNICFQWSHLTLYVSFCVNTAARQALLGGRAHCSHTLTLSNIVLHNLNCLKTIFRVNCVVNCNTGPRPASK